MSSAIIFALAVALVAVLLIPVDDAFADHSEVAIVTVDESGVTQICADEQHGSGCYTPVTATVDVGGVVTMTNTDPATGHTFTSGTVDGFTPSPDGTFDTGILMLGDSFEWTPTQAGEVPYYCMLHTWMVGTIVVQEAAAEEVEVVQLTINSFEIYEDGDYTRYHVIGDAPESTNLTFTMTKPDGSNGDYNGSAGTGQPSYDHDGLVSPNNDLVYGTWNFEICAPEHNMCVQESFTINPSFTDSVSLQANRLDNKYQITGEIISSTEKDSILYLRVSDLDQVEYSTGWNHPIHLEIGVNPIDETLCCLPTNDEYEVTLIQLDGVFPPINNQPVDTAAEAADTTPAQNYDVFVSSKNHNSDITINVGDSVTLIYPEEGAGMGTHYSHYRFDAQWMNGSCGPLSGITCIGTPGWGLGLIPSYMHTFDQVGTYQYDISHQDTYTDFLGTINVVESGATPPTDDITLPIITPSSNLNFSNGTGPQWYSIPTATDNIGIATDVTCTPPPGSSFSVGTTTVECSVTDYAGNEGSASFTITVTDDTGNVPTSNPQSYTVLVNEMRSGNGATNWDQSLNTGCTSFNPQTCYTPSVITINVGDSVTWVNNDPTNNWYTLKGNFGGLQPIYTDNYVGTGGYSGGDGGCDAPGHLGYDMCGISGYDITSWTHTFDTVGTYNYHDKVYQNYPVRPEGVVNVVTSGAPTPVAVAVLAAAEAAADTTPPATPTPATPTPATPTPATPTPATPTPATPTPATPTPATPTPATPTPATPTPATPTPAAPTPAAPTRTIPDTPQIPGIVKPIYLPKSEITISAVLGSSNSECAEKRQCYTPYTSSVLLDGVVIMFNPDTVAHTFTSGSAGAGPSGVFDTGLMMAGDTQSFSFGQPGNYPYYCMIHPWMEGAIVVSDVKSEAVNGEMSISMNPDRHNYENGNKVIINGKIHNFDHDRYKGDNISFMLKSPEDRILSTGQFAINPDGSFTYTTFAMDSSWKIDGNYIFNVQFGSTQSSIVIYYDNTKYDKPVATPTPATPTPATPTPATPTPATPTPATPTPATPTPSTQIPATPTPTMPAPTTSSLVDIELFTNNSIYDLGEIVDLFVKANGFSGTKTVAVDVTDPRGNTVVSRSVNLSPNTSGEIEFKLSENFRAGTYTTTATILDSGQIITDISYFKIKSQFNSFTISDVSSTDQQGNLSPLEAGEMGFIKVNLKSNKLISTLVTVNLFDSELTSMGIGSVKTNLSSGDSEIILSFMIPDDAAIGNADIYVNAFSDWPSNGGIALTSEFAITQYVGGDSSTIQPSGYQGNVGSAGETGSYTLEEALEIQKRVGEGMTVKTVEEVNAGELLKISVVASHKTSITIKITDIEGQDIADLGCTTTKEFVCETFWSVPKDAIPGTYVIKVNDSISSDEATFEIKSIPEPVTNFQNYGIFITSVPEQGSRSVSINGTTSNQSTDVTIRVLSPDGDNVIAVDQITPNSDGTFSTEFNVSNWKQDGMHMFKVSQGTDLMFRDSIQVNIINGVIE